MTDKPLAADWKRALLLEQNERLPVNAACRHDKLSHPTRVSIDPDEWWWCCEWCRRWIPDPEAHPGAAPLRPVPEETE